MAGQQNTISEPYASVSGGRVNTASGEGASVSGGYGNVANGTFAAIGGGESNTAARHPASAAAMSILPAVGPPALAGAGPTKLLRVADTASGWYATSISGGQNNTVSSQAGSDLNDVRKLAEYVQVVDGDLNYLSGPRVIFRGVNIHIQNGTQQTGLVNGRGNLIMGYNEPLGVQAGQRAGSHNLVAGLHHRWRLCLQCGP